MDIANRLAKRCKDPVADLVALTRMPALRSLPPCRHCGRDLSAVDLGECPSYEDTWSHSDDGCPRCNGTGRTEWPWRGDTGRLALLAYCGDEAARAGLPRTTPAQWRECHPANTWRGVDGLSFDAWLRGLDRWPDALLAAWILAGRAVLPIMRPLMPSGTEVLWRDFLAACDAIDAATEHHHCGCAASREAWSAACELLPGPVHWVPCPQDDWTKGAIAMAIEATDEPTIRAAICAGLAKWARTGVL